LKFSKRDVLGSTSFVTIVGQRMEWPPCCLDYCTN
jgi:hypothetical protein